jgi:shikimate kinase
MGAGKTSVGQALATVLGWRFVDLDARITAKTGRTVAQIFELDGETVFRRMEHNELRELLAELGEVSTVVSLGGGAWMQSANVAAVQGASLPVLFLDASPDELWQRCLPEQGTRPLLQSESEFRRLYEARRVAYETGTVRIETQGRSVEEVASQIGLLLGLTQAHPAT